MPTYLCHGFRWQRRSIRVYVIVQDLDDASPEWIIPAKSSICILQSFYRLFGFLPYCTPRRGRHTPVQGPESDDDSVILHSANGTPSNHSRSRGRSQTQSSTQSSSPSLAKQAQPLPPLPNSSPPGDDFSAQSWSVVKLLEEYDPRDLTTVSQPHAYVADYAVRIDLSCSIADEMARYEQQQKQEPKPGWLNELRDQLQRDEEIRWYVVVNGDEVRDWGDDDEEEVVEESPLESQPSRPEQNHSPYQYQPQYQYQLQPGRPAPTRGQIQHHAQYILQQQIFEGELKQQLGSVGVVPPEPAGQPAVPDKDYLPPIPAAAVPLRSKGSIDGGSSGRPKTPGSKGGGLRKLFGRSSNKAT